MAAPLRAVVVDDEPLARERLVALLAEVAPHVEVVGQAEGGRAAVPLVHRERPDVVFLDVAMPVIDGFDVVDLLAPPRPHVVFVTAYDDHALRAFEVHALDYLVKPVARERLAEAVRRVGAVERPATGAASAADGLDALRGSPDRRPLSRLAVHVGRRLRVVDVAEVDYFEASEKLVLARLRGAPPSAELPVDFTLDALERRLDPGRFVRSHRAFLVHLDRVREVVPWFSGGYRLRLDGGAELPVSRRRARDVRAVLTGRRS